MKKISSLVIALLIICMTTNANNYSSTDNGKWYWPSTWGHTEENNYPQDGDAATVNHTITDAGTCSSLNITSSGKLYSYVTVNGNIINSGELRDDPNHGSDYINVSFSGNLNNSGVTGIANTYMTGSSGQTISSNSASPLILGYTQFTDTNNTVTIASTTTFLNTSFLCSGASFVIDESLTSLFFEACTLDGGVIETNGCVLHMDSSSNGSRSELGWNGAGTFGPKFTTLKNATLESNKYIYMEPSGTGDWGLELFNCINNATIMGNGTFYTDSTFTNNGTINGIYTGIYNPYTMSIIAKGDFIHNGNFNSDVLLYPQKNVYFNLGATWDDTKVYMDGTSDQEITFDEDVVPYHLYINSNIEGATTFQWYLDGILLTGKTSEDLVLNSGGSMSIADIDGVYHCVSDQGNSRYVSVISGNDFDEPLEPTGFNGTVANDNKSIALRWHPNTEIDLLHYQLFRDDSLLKITTDTFYVDTTYTGASARYYVNATDTANNVSSKATASVSYPQIHSTAAGGYWNNESSWIGGIKPTASDSVVINGPISIGYINPSVSHLFVTDSGSINKYSDNTTLTVSGNLYIDGEVTCQSNGINIEGNLIINGTLNSRTIKFTGTQDHLIYMHDTATVISNNIGAPESRIVAKTDLYFGKKGASMTQIYAQELDLSEGHNLHLQNSRLGYQYLLSRSYVKGGNGSAIYSNVGNPNNQYFCEYIDLENVLLHGNTYFNAGVTLKGNVTNEDSMLIAVSNNNYPVIVQGNFTNNHYLKTDLQFNFHQNVVNNGYFESSQILFVGDEIHEVSCLNNNVINAYYGVRCDSSKILAMSNLHFSTNNISRYNVVETDLSNGYDLYLHNFLVGDNFGDLRAVIKGAGNKVKMSGLNSYYANCDLYNVTLLGINSVTSGLALYGDVFIQDTLTGNGYNNRTLNVYGSLTNNGFIGTVNGSYRPYINLHQSFTNNGVCESENITLVGDSIHELSTLNQNEIYATYGFVCDSSKVVAMSDLYLKSNYDKYNVVETDLSNGFNLHFNQMRVGYGSWDNRAVIKGAGNSVELTGASSYYGKCDIYNATLTGIGIATNSLGLYGDIVNEGTLTGNNYSDRTISVYGDLTNNGFIGASTGYYKPYLNIYQNFVNDSTCDLQKLTFIGDSIHNVACPNNHPIVTENGVLCDSSKVIATGDLYFSTNGYCEYNVIETNLSNGFNLHIQKLRVGAYWDKRASIKASNNELRMTGDGFYADCDIYNAKLTGITQATNGCDFYGETVVIDTLTGDNWNSRTIDVYGNLTNYGRIGSAPWGEKPYVKIYSNLFNQGTWNSETVQFLGSNNQSIQLNTAITARVEFISDTGNTNFLWKKDDEDIQGATSSIYVFNSTLSEIDAGVYYCTTDEGNSRTISVNNSTTVRVPESINSNATLSFYPNPASTQIHLQGINHEAYYQICTLAGKLVQNDKVMDGNISVENLNNGLYIIQITYNDVHTTHSLVIRK